ncbi:MAG TPA: D-aminoacyl-tRNA deacylase [Isosphaeraceae bacterium]|nr:D-aminoacyl-tRNA deacylase [Isosphaeraceae bacterium]
MRAVLQRVSHASVTIDAQTVAQINSGWLVLLGVAKGDTDDDANRLADKVVGLRAFEDADGKMNLDVRETGGSVLVVSQFTLLGDCRKGRRPSFIDAADPDDANRLYEHFAEAISERGVPVARGVFRAEMQVSLVNEGPVTLLLDSRRLF